eukprot:m.42665 g.42665  ORF g.42665 m.42665 type:complete len:514 (-) comp6309_c0_seq1:93-1634(-)
MGWLAMARLAWRGGGSRPCAATLPLCRRQSTTTTPPRSGAVTVSPSATPIYPTPTFPGVSQVAHWTDVEGNWAYFSRLVERSEAVQWADASRRELSLKPGCALVYGGDAFDKGPGDLRIAEALVGLKQRFPDRVVLLIGNRDVNKMRFRSELHASDLARPIHELTLPFWGSKAMQNAMTSFYDLDDNPIHRLKFILTSMGATQAFEFRRTELALLQGRPRVDVTCDAVFESFVTATEPGGAYHSYLTHGQLAAVWGNTMFMHGGMTPASCGYVLPDHLPCARNDESHVLAGRDTRGVLSVQKWVHELHDATARSLSRWDGNPLWDSDRSFRAGENLMAFAFTAASLGRSIIVSSFHVDGDLAVAPQTVRDYLGADGICRTVVGHKPSGQLPGIVRSDGFEQVSSDTSFSDTGAHDNRGCAVSEVLIEGDPHCNQVRVHGVLADGRPVDFHTPPLGLEYGSRDLQARLAARGDTLVGTRTEEGSWVRAPLDPPRYLTATAQGFDVFTGEWEADV